MLYKWGQKSQTLGGYRPSNFIALFLWQHLSTVLATAWYKMLEIFHHLFILFIYIYMFQSKCNYIYEYI